MIRQYIKIKSITNNFTVNPRKSKKKTLSQSSSKKNSKQIYGYCNKWFNLENLINCS